MDCVNYSSTRGENRCPQLTKLPFREIGKLLPFQSSHKNIPHVIFREYLLCFVHIRGLVNTPHFFFPWRHRVVGPAPEPFVDRPAHNGRQSCKRTDAVVIRIAVPIRLNDHACSMGIEPIDSSPIIRILPGNPPDAADPLVHLQAVEIRPHAEDGVD